MKSNFRDFIVDVPDFPKPGIIFKDITPILENGELFKQMTLELCESLPPETQKLVAIESRGFILASAMSQHNGCGVVLVRKPGKLPRKTISQTYSLEYGDDELQIHDHSIEAGESVVIVDDVLATGGTAEAAESLIHKAGGLVSQFCFLMEIDILKGRSLLKAPVSSLMNV